MTSINRHSVGGFIYFCVNAIMPPYGERSVASAFSKASRRVFQCAPHGFECLIITAAFSRNSLLRQEPRLRQEHYCNSSFPAEANRWPSVQCSALVGFRRNASPAFTKAVMSCRENLVFTTCKTRTPASKTRFVQMPWELIPFFFRQCEPRSARTSA